jgi:hypothetical protein
MYKKRHFMGNSALFLTVLLAFIGCPIAGLLVVDEAYSREPESAEAAAKALAETLNSAGGNNTAIAAGTTVNLLKDIMIFKKPDSSALMSRAAASVALGDGILVIPGGVTFKVDAGRTVTVEADAAIAVEAGGTVTLAAIGTAAAGGKIAIRAGGTLEVKASGTVDVQAQAALTVDAANGGSAGKLKVDGTVILAASAAVTVAGALDGNGAITGAGKPDLSKAAVSGSVAGKSDVDLIVSIRDPITNAADDLSAAITKAKALGGKGVVQLSEAFYNAANEAGTALVIDAGTERNTTPYTIRGLGKDGRTLSVGVLLANDKVTLEGVRIAVTEKDKATPATPWTETSNYKSAVYIGRVDDSGSPVTGAAHPSEGVTITDCDISVDFSNAAVGIPADPFTSAVWVSAARGGATGDALYNPKNITISNNTISATGLNGYATQGVLLIGYDYSIAITGNTISAQYGAPQTGKRYGAPASALFFTRVYGENLMGSGAPRISGNTLKLEGNSAYSFYINAYETSDEAILNQNGGVTVLRGDNFTIATTTWALNASNDTGSSYKKLFTALLDNITTTGFGSISIPQAAGNSYDFEHYHIAARQVTRISVLGDHIVGGKYEGDGDPNQFGTEGDAPKGVDYGSFEVENGVVKGTKNGKFYFTYDTYDNDYHFNNR